MRNLILITAMTALLLCASACGGLTRRGGAVPSRDLETLDTVVETRRAADSSGAPAPAGETSPAKAEASARAEPAIVVSAIPEEEDNGTAQPLSERVGAALPKGTATLKNAGTVSPAEPVEMAEKAIEKETAKVFVDVDAPVASLPVAEEPVALLPAIKERAESAQVAEEPVALLPAIKERTVSAQVAEEPVALLPETEKPVVSAPMVDVDAPVESVPVTVDAVAPVESVPVTVDAVAPVESVSVAEASIQPAPQPERAASYRKKGLRSGYRVQLMATTEPDRARSFAETLRPLFDTRVYVEYLEPYYKVRLGDCPTRADAVLLLNKARTLGFAESWITATQIIDWSEGPH